MDQCSSVDQVCRLRKTRRTKISEQSGEEFFDYLREIDLLLDKFGERRDSIVLAILYHDLCSIDISDLRAIYQKLKSIEKNGIEREVIDIVLQTNGGDLHAAYTIARSLQDWVSNLEMKSGSKQKCFNVIVADFVCSAGIYVALSGDNLVFTQTGQLIPHDIQIRKFGEPLPVRSLLEATDLITRLILMKLDHFSHDKSLLINIVDAFTYLYSKNKVYREMIDLRKMIIYRILKNRMLKSRKDREISKIVEKLVNEIMPQELPLNYQHVKNLGLNSSLIEEEFLQDLLSQVIDRFYRLEMVFYKFDLRPFACLRLNKYIHLQNGIIVVPYVEYPTA